MPERPYLSEAEADAILARARAAAASGGTPMTITVVDDGGHLLRLVRMDGVPLVSLDVAVAKARTAARMRMSTAVLAGIVDKTPALLAIPEVLPFPGGMPLIVDGVCVGAIGASGGSPEEDEAVAAAGAG